jgi:hypothetical protein
MSKVDAERAMAIYRKFTKQTDYVVQYLGVARQHEHHTRVEVPKLKHAPVNLGRQLEEYLHDPDFEVHRRQYLAEQDVKKIGGGSKQGGLSKKKSSDFPAPASNNPFPKMGSSSTGNNAPESKPQANKGPDPDLIDFFDSIEQNQTTMNVNPQSQPQPFQQQPTGMPFQQNGFAAQPTGFASNSPFQQPQQTGAFMQPQPQIQLQPDFTGAGFGGFTPQPQGFQPNSLSPIPQDSMANFPNAAPQVQQPAQTGQPQGLQPMQTGSTNPFRQSMLMAQQTGLPSSATTPNVNRQSTNPFARSSPQQNTSPFAPNSNSPYQSPQQPQQQPAPLQAAPTGTNPFARNSMLPPANQEQRPQTAGAALAPQPTGTTNPFRQGAFVNHSTGQGWQANQQPIGGGLDQIPTVPVFPRPANQVPWQQ